MEKKKEVNCPGCEQIVIESCFLAGAITELRERFCITESRLIALALRIPEKRVKEIIRLSAM